MKILFTLLLPLILVSCASTQYSSNFGEFQEPMNEVQRIFPNVNFSDITIKFADIKNKDVLASCKMTPWSKIIEIDHVSWFEMSDLEKFLMILHEVGHCKFNLEHSNGWLTKSCPKSIMHEYLMPPLCYRVFKQYYIDGLRSSIVYPSM